MFTTWICSSMLFFLFTIFSLSEDISTRLLPIDDVFFVPEMAYTLSSQQALNDTTLSHILTDVSVPPYQCVLGASRDVHAILSDIEVCCQCTEVCFEGFRLLPSERTDHFALSTRDRLLQCIQYFNLRIQSLTAELQYYTDLYLFRLQESKCLQEYSFQCWWSVRFLLL